MEGSIEVETGGSADDGVNIPLLRRALNSIADGGKAPPPTQPQASAPRQPAEPAASTGSNEFSIQEPPPQFMGIGQGSTPPVTPQEPASSQETPEPPEVKKDPKARSAWEYQKKENKTLKEQLASAEKARKELETSVEQAKSQKTEKEEELSKTVERLENELGRFSLEATSEFKNRRVKPIQDAQSKAANVFVKSGKSLEEATELVRYLMADSTAEEDIERTLGELPKYAQGVVATAIFDARELDQARQRDLTNWKQARAAMDAEESRTTEHLRKATLVKDTSLAIQELTEKHGSWVFKANPDSPEWEKQRERLVLEAQHILAEGTDQDLARSVVEATASQYYRRWGESLAKQNEELKRALENRDAARPRIGMGGGQPPRAPAPPPDPKAPKGIDQVFREVGIGR